jgi:hypothetical protein
MMSDHATCRGSGNEPSKRSAREQQPPQQEATSSGSLPSDEQRAPVQAPVNLEAGEQEREVREERSSQVERIVSLVTQLNVELFKDSHGTAYLSFVRDGHRETRSLESPEAADFVGHYMYESTGEVARGPAIDEALRHLISVARYAGDTRDVHLRVAGVDDAIYLDLGDADWRAVKVTAAGWEVVSSPPVYFRRPPGMHPLPEPERGGQLCELADILNLGDEDSQKLILGWLVETLNPAGPYPLLVLYGGQGAGKSTTARGLRHLVDPHATLLRAAPRREEDLAVAARANRVLAFDNLSKVWPWLSDALCRLATGGGFAGRRFYTNLEEYSVDITAPVLINGIASEMLEAPDLLDRTVLVELPSIAHRRQTSEEVWQRLEEARPRLLGALLDAAGSGLRHRSTVNLSEEVRMMDFAMWVEACAPALGWKRGSFSRAYQRARNEAVSGLVQTWPSLPLIQAVIDQRKGEFAGTVQDLLKALKKFADSSDLWEGGLPRTARKLSDELRKHADALKVLGMDVTFEPRGSRGRMVRIRLRPPQAVSLPTRPKCRYGDDG